MKGLLLVAVTAVLCHVAHAGFVGAACRGSPGKCIDVKKDTCTGTVRTGLCPGPANIKCCVPAGQTPSNGSGESKPSQLPDLPQLAGQKSQQGRKARKRSRPKGRRAKRTARRARPRSGRVKARRAKPRAGRAKARRARPRGGAKARRAKPRAGRVKARRARPKARRARPRGGRAKARRARPRSGRARARRARPRGRGRSRKGRRAGRKRTRKGGGRRRKRRKKGGLGKKLGKLGEVLDWGGAILDNAQQSELDDYTGKLTEGIGATIIDKGFAPADEIANKADEFIAKIPNKKLRDGVQNAKEMLYDGSVGFVKNTFKDLHGNTAALASATKDIIQGNDGKALQTLGKAQEKMENTDNPILGVVAIAGNLLAGDQDKAFQVANQVQRNMENSDNLFIKGANFIGKHSANGIDHGIRAATRGAKSVSKWAKRWRRRI